jgi:Ca-activated chloride channel family protein
MKSYSKNGFTIVEFLIILAIVAIIAALAKPCFLEAQVSSKNAAKRMMMNYYAYKGCAAIGPEFKTGEFNTETFDQIMENPFVKSQDNPLSTFSIDVDTASYTIMRRDLNLGKLPPCGAVRIEELINYFSYDYPQPENGEPFSVNVEVSQAPWNTAHRLIRIALKGKDVVWTSRPPCNFVFLIDVSGSMDEPNKLPLVKRSLEILTQKLDQNDRVAIVLYAGASGLVLDSTRACQTDAILSAIKNLQAGGCTNGGEGIQLAYEIAGDYFIENGINRVILTTDGDFNVGSTSQSDLIDLVKAKAKEGIYLSVCGFGMRNLKDSTLEKLADKGNANYAYIDSFSEARKVFLEQIAGTLITIAKDVKIQVEFNPRLVKAYRLIGYENRKLADEDFNDDGIDAGEIGAGHTVTAFYEIIPFEVESPELEKNNVDPLKYQTNRQPSQESGSDEIMTVKLRYKEPSGTESRLITHIVQDDGKDFTSSSPDFKFAAAVAEFGLLLRNSEFKGNASFDRIPNLVEMDPSHPEYDRRREFLNLVQNALTIQAGRVFE